MRPHSSLGYRSPAPETILPPASGLTYSVLYARAPRLSTLVGMTGTAGRDALEHPIAITGMGKQVFWGSQQEQSEEPALPVIFSQSVISAKTEMSSWTGVAVLRSVDPCFARCGPARAVPSGALATASATCRTRMGRFKDAGPCLLVGCILSWRLWSSC